MAAMATVITIEIVSTLDIRNLVAAVLFLNGGDVQFAQRLPGLADFAVIPSGEIFTVSEVLDHLSRRTHHEGHGQRRAVRHLLG
jgi:hypothetical protein